MFSSISLDGLFSCVKRSLKKDHKFYLCSVLVKKFAKAFIYKSRQVVELFPF